MQTHPTPLRAISSSILSQAEKTPIAKIETNEKAILLSTSKDLGTADAEDKKLETKSVCSGLDPTELPKRVLQQLNSPKAIRSFKALDSLFKDLKERHMDIIMAAIYQNALKYDLEKIQSLQKIAAGFIRSFEGEFNFIAHPDRLKRLQAMFKFLPNNSGVQFEKVSKITLGFEHITSLGQWFSKDKTVVCLEDNEAQELPDLIGGLEGFRTLDLSRCENLKSIQNIGLCKTLKYIKGTALSQLETLAGIEACKELEEVVLDSCHSSKRYRCLRGISEAKEGCPT